MKIFIALYLKELKDARNLSCILAIGTLVLQGWVLLSVETLMIALFFSSLPLWAIMFVLPFLLASSFTGEWRGNTTYLLFALPVRAAVVCLCKFAAIFSVGLMLFSVSGTGVYTVVARAPEEDVSQLLGFFGVTPGAVSAYTAGFLGSYAFLSLGIVSAAEGARYTAPRLRGLVTAASFVMCAIIYLTMAGYFVNGLLGSLPTGPALMAYTVFSGLVFLLIGLFLFEKFVEI
ncbi:MAG: hypothetical protein J4F39_01885 [Candidatus Latescibacteria bacterium]|nr:hypothetical protein [Candidatus Latescibacterota bacterium]